MRRGLGLLAGVVATSGLLAACSSDDEVTVMVAASLCDLAEQSAERMAGEADVRVTCGGSSDLVAQLESGASADLIITANMSTANDVVELGLGDIERIIATNELVLVTPAGNPGNVTGFDESLNSVNTVTCAPQVPCGQVTGDLAERNGLDLEPVSEEQSVTDVLGKVTEGQADAGLVYRTDAARAGDLVEVMDIPHSEEFPNDYPLLYLGDGEPSEAAVAWVKELTEGEGREAMIAGGFTVVDP